MLLALGAASSAIDALLGLTSSTQAQPAGHGQNHANLFAFQADATSSTGSTAASTAGGCSPISPETMSALLAAQSQASQSFASQGRTVAPVSRENALKDLFGQIDANGDGKITKDEFENALGAGGTNLAQADDVFGKLDKTGEGTVSLGEMSSALRGGRGHHHHHMAEGAGDSSDPTAAAASASGAANSATSSYNFIEQLIPREASLISSQASSSLSVSV